MTAFVIGTDLPNRCRSCGFHPQLQGHRSASDDGLISTGCPDVGPIHESEQRRHAARANVEADTSAEEWRVFVAALNADAAAHGGLVSQNRVRLAIGHRWVSVTAKRRYSQMWAKARRELGLIEVRDDQGHVRTEQSTDKAGGNAHRLVPILRLENAA